MKSKRRTQAEQQRIRDEVRQAIAEPRGEPMAPSGIGFRESRSQCCGASVRVEGDTTQHYVCLSCGKACDLRMDAGADVGESLEAFEG